MGPLGSSYIRAGISPLLSGGYETYPLAMRPLDLAKWKKEKDSLKNNSEGESKK